ncbi:hypothetical protein DGI_2665 [Megalodesulfovibrio gigas DSM 1382 = ATCC 19364]|uniref:SPOR domain-containing protein n=1 Tax=Megalodesulfovibrio gigas (strain ATCC 19364 / DSM 1382 / NCIMB 9332 / VKM B-1759) TaxID=1121448 RepID=T2GE44_MEGG1|nr:hypothetical protein DGI_2665 [Megalodesulfovibrio gigas DSM 1382 = ATCC 19364]
MLQGRCRCLLPVAAVASLLLGWVPAAAAFTATAKAAGMYGENVSSAPRGMDCAGVHAKLARQGETVSAQLLARFGMELLIEGGKQGAPARLDVELSHPPVQQPGHAEPVRSRKWEVPACVGVPVLVAWTFLADWELAPGDWTFDVSHQGKALLSKTFKVVEETMPEPEAQLSISLTPKVPAAAAGNATGNATGNASGGAITPEAGMAALALLRGIEPGVAAMVLDEAEAKALAGRSTAAGLPAVVKPVLRSTGMWHAVVVWDFAQPSADQGSERAGPAGEALAVQLGSYREHAEAVAYADSLAQYGIQVFIESLQGDAGVLHTVRVGPFDATRSGRDQAVRTMDKLRARGVRLPLLTRTPEPVEHVVWKEPQAPPPPAPAEPLLSMEETKSRLNALMEMARTDEVLEQIGSRRHAQDNATDEAPEAEQPDEVAPGVERRPRITPAVEEFAKTASRGVVGQVQVQIGPFKKRAEAEAFRRLVTSKERPAVVTDVPAHGVAVQVGDFANAQAASAAGADWIARHAPEAGLSAMVVKEEGRSRSAGAASPGKPAASPAGTRFVLQLASTASKDEAERQCAVWAAKGLDARRVELPGALGRVHAVRVGDYATLPAAKAAAQAIHEAHGVLPMVVEEAPGGP